MFYFEKSFFPDVPKSVNVWVFNQNFTSKFKDFIIKFTVFPLVKKYNKNIYLQYSIKEID